MSFSVTATDNPPSPHISPSMRPYVSPQLLPQSTQRMPPLSLSLNDEHGPAKRVGTDPTKYKTSICRNWEQTGTCTFRGCTFAHGVEELRAPTKTEQHSPHHQSQYVSPTGTPPLMAASSSAPTKLEGLLEMLHTEVTRERELVAVHIEANRTLEGMLRREQTQHMEAKMLLEEKGRQLDFLMEQIMAQHELLKAVAETAEPSSKIGIQIREFLQNTTDAIPFDILGRDMGNNIINNNHELMESGAPSEMDCMEDDERIQQLLRALQQ